MLNLNKTVEGTKVKFDLEGRLDTITSPEWEEAIQESVTDATQSSPCCTEDYVQARFYGCDQRKRDNPGNLRGNRILGYSYNRIIKRNS